MHFDMRRRMAQLQLMGFLVLSAVLDLVQAAMRLYPESEFSAMHHGPMH
jgi:hypothetical protein